jgi:hypothetical protein
MKTKINAIKVVHYTVERFIKLMSAYNQSQTKNEEELQDVLQVVEDHYKRIPDCSKATIVSYQQPYHIRSGGNPEFMLGGFFFYLI